MLLYNINEEIIILGWVIKRVPFVGEFFVLPVAWPFCGAGETSLLNMWTPITLITICAKKLGWDPISINMSIFSFSGGVLCGFSVSVQKSERQRRGHALPHRSFHVQGEHFCLKHCNYFQWNLGEVESNVKLVQIQIMVIMILKLNNVIFTMIQRNPKDLNTFQLFSAL